MIKLTSYKNEIDRNGNPIIMFYAGDEPIAYVGKRVSSLNRTNNSWIWGLWKGYSSKYSYANPTAAIEAMKKHKQFTSKVEVF